MAYDFTLDMDRNGMLSLTEKNVQLISSILRVDPRYRDAFRGAEGSVQQLFRIYGLTQDYRELTKIVIAICSVPSYFYTADVVARIVDVISGIEDLESSLRRGESSLVKEIAIAAVPGRYYIDFASKFCAYACAYVLGEDNYIIYDTVMGDVLPYYAYYHLKETYMHRVKSVWPALIMEEDGYDYCRGLINRIIDDVAEKSGYTMTFLEFYNTLWYYYQGNGRERRRMIAEKVREIRGE